MNDQTKEDITEYFAVLKSTSAYAYRHKFISSSVFDDGVLIGIERFIDDNMRVELRVPRASDDGEFVSFDDLLRDLWD